MNEFLDGIRIICILGWIAFTVLTATEDINLHDYKIMFYMSAIVIIVTNLLSCIAWRYDNARKIKRPDYKP